MYYIIRINVRLCYIKSFGGFMKFYKFFPFFCIVFFILSCSSMPVKEYNDVTILREGATKYDLLSYAEEPFNIAETNYNEASLLMDENKEPKKAKDLLLTASNNYKIVLDEALPLYANDLKGDISEERNTAFNLKAHKAAREEYELGELNYIEAIVSLCKNNYEIAIEGLMQSREYYNGAYLTSKERYDQSVLELEKLNEVMKEIDDVAKEISDYESSK